MIEILWVTKPGSDMAPAFKAILVMGRRTCETFSVGVSDSDGV